MGQYLQTNGDYTIVASGNDQATGGTITLNTGINNVGKVIVTGTLQVEGNTLTVDTQDLFVEDNIIVVNKGETGAGISVLSKRAGIQVDRGTLQPASILYNETTKTWEFCEANNIFLNDPIPNDPTFFEYANSAIRVRSVRTDISEPDLNLIGDNSLGVVNVKGTFGSNVVGRASAYETRVSDPDDVPNKAYVDNSIRDNPTFQIVDDDTRVIVTDIDAGFFDAFDPGFGINDPENAGTAEKYLLDQTGGGIGTGNNSAVTVIVQGSLISQFYSDSFLIGDRSSKGIEIKPVIGESEITNAGSLTDENIYIKTSGTGKLKTNRGIELTTHTTTLSNPVGAVVMYSNAPGVGNTGIFVANDNTTDELITKNKALLLSMIF